MDVLHRTPAPSENEQLVNEIVKGNRRAESQLVAKYYRPLLFILRQQTKDLDLADDLCQDSFCIALKKIRNQELKNPNGISAFIRSIGINTLIEFKRKKTRQKTDATGDFSHIECFANDNTEAQVSKTKVLELLGQVLAEMPAERDREILFKSFIDGSDKQTICATLSLSPEHHDRVLYRAKQRLRQLMAIKLSLKDSKFRLYDIVSICLLLATASQISSSQVREDPFQHHFTIDVLMKSQILR